PPSLYYYYTPPRAPHSFLHDALPISFPQGAPGPARSARSCAPRAPTCAGTTAGETHKRVAQCADTEGQYARTRPPAERTGSKNGCPQTGPEAGGAGHSSAAAWPDPAEEFDQPLTSGHDSRCR